ncbi:MAG: hypothetical protein ABID87_01745 [Chloroflexota bacterium]
MSRFITALKKAAGTAPSPMGFHRTVPAARPRMLLVAAVAGAGDAAARAITGNADAVLFPSLKSSPAGKASARSKKAEADTPWGVMLAEAGKTAFKGIGGSDCDFVVFPPETDFAPVTALEDIGRIIRIDPSLEEGLVRALNRLPVDAVVIAASGKEFTWQQLMRWQRITGLLTKPVLLTVPPDVSREVLQALWDSGIDGAVVEVGAASADRLKALKETIADLSPRSPRDKREALLPYPREKTEVSRESEEEEEPEEDE